MKTFQIPAGRVENKATEASKGLLVSVPEQVALPRREQPVTNETVEFSVTQRDAVTSSWGPQRVFLRPRTMGRDSLPVPAEDAIEETVRMFCGTTVSHHRRGVMTAEPDLH
jgi:hypothetical protein